MAPPPKQRSLSQLLDAFVARSALVATILIAGGTLGLLALPLLERKISFDENALLAGSARPTIRSKSPGAYQTGKSFAASLSGTLFSPGFTPALQQQLAQQLGLAVFNHTFTTAAAGGTTTNSSSSRGNPIICTNVHAVLGSPRGDGKEALVLVTPINHQPHTTDFEQDASGVLLSLALGGALLSHLSAAAPWLAKEVIWVLPDASCGLMEAVQAWTDAYQYPVLQHSSSELSHFDRSGVLQQALLLELPTGTFNSLQVSLEGHDGLLPKLDMFWLIRWYCYNYVRAPLQLPQMGALQQHLAADNSLVNLLFHGGLTGISAAATNPTIQALQQHAVKFITLCQFMWRQARGLPTGAHAPFKGLMVDAATLRVLKKDPSGLIVGPAGFTGVPGNIKQHTTAGSNPKTPASNPKTLSEPQQVLGFDEGLAQLADVAELLLRSCSVLIERFHHSLFLYVLTGLDHYVSVERYIGPLVALIAVLLLQAAVARGRSPAAETEADQPPSIPRQPLRARLLALWTRARSSSSSSTADAEAEQTPQLQQHDYLCLPPPAEAAAARAQWVSAVILVASAHTLAAALGVALRQAPVLLLLLQPQAVTAWLAAATAAPGDHVTDLGVGCGLLLALLAAFEGVRSVAVTPGSSRRGTDGAAVLSSSSSKACGDVRKVLVVELSVAAAAMAAVACLNWALGYVTCLVLVPLAVGCAPPSVPRSNSSGKPSKWKALLVLLCCSPAMVLLLLSGLSSSIGVAAGFQLEWLHWLVLGSSFGTYMVFWAVYVPFWWLTAWSMYMHKLAGEAKR